MASDDTYKNLREGVMKNNHDEVRRILNDNAEVDLRRKFEDEENLIGVAIQYSDARMLALLLGIPGPPFEHDKAISNYKLILLNCPCDSNGNTPLLKAVQLGKVDVVSLLLSSGAEVNYFPQYDRPAIELSTDPEVLHLLFTHDSKFPTNGGISEKLREIIKEDKDLSDYFKERDALHESISKGDVEPVKSFICNLEMETNQKKYFVNRYGESLLFTAIKNYAFDAWANLLDLGMCYANECEKSLESEYKEMCERSLSKVLLPLEDCHLQKLLSKTAISQRVSQGMKMVSEFYDYLNGIEITRTLMEVVQDIPGLRIDFDLERTSIERLRPCSSDKHRGILDFEQLKICVAAKRDDVYGLPEIASNLAHELCHLAMHVVYENNGLPYRKGDTDREREFIKIMESIMGSTGCHHIISKIWGNYRVGEHRQELIVRVPEIMALEKKCGSNEDISSDEEQSEELRTPIFKDKNQRQQCMPDESKSHFPNPQEKELVSYYENHVQPDLRKYIAESRTSGRIMGRTLMNYLELLSPMERIQVNEGIDNPIIGQHNNLKILRASDVKLAQSHLKSCFKKEGKEQPYFCEWSLYQKIEGSIKILLKTEEIKTLVISWDCDECPKFCRSKSCGVCTGFFFRDYTDCVYLLVSTKWDVLKNIKANDYSWVDLSLDTQKMIQDRKVEFGGELVNLKNLFTSTEDEDCLEKFMKECLDSKDIHLLLEENDIHLGKTNSFMDDQCEGMVLKHPEVCVPRELTVKFDQDMLRKCEDDFFLLSNVTISDLRIHGINGSDIREWNVSSSNSTARCYVLQSSFNDVNEESGFQEVLKHLRGLPSGQAKKLNHLHFRGGKFVYRKSIIILNECENYLDRVEDITPHANKGQIRALDFDSTDPLLLADDPGTGKSIFFHSLAKEIKQSHPDKWVYVVNLSSTSQQKFLMQMEGKKSLSERETLDSLFMMVGSGSNNSLERKIFNKFCQMKNKIVVFFDGFDEICPHYKSVTTLFVKNLRNICGNIKVAVSTRMHEELDLEDALKVKSFQLVSFGRDNQEEFLNEYWNELMSMLCFSEWQEKMECSIAIFKKWNAEKHDDGISELLTRMEEMLTKEKAMEKRECKLNFIPVAKRFLYNEDPFVEGLDTFLKNPLLLQMFAFLLFQDSFTAKQMMNLGHLYQRYVELKMKIYHQEKAHSSGNVQSKEMTRMIGERNMEIMEKLSFNLLLGESWCEIKDNDKRDACNIGLLMKTDEDYHFIHQTFAEFFFARRMLRKAGKSKVTKLWLERLFVDNQFGRVRKFIEDILDLMSEEFTDYCRAGDLGLFKKANLEQSVLDNPSDLIIPMYRIVKECSVHTLQYFADSFGEKVSEVLIKEVHVNDCNVAIEGILYRYKGWTTCNAFALLAEYWDKWTENSWTAYAAISNKGKSGDYVTLVKVMLKLVEKSDMLNNLKESLLMKGIMWLLPNYRIDYDKRKDGCLVYIKEVLIFLLEHKDIFGDVLREWIASKSKDSCQESSSIINYWNQSFLVKLFSVNFDLLPLVIDAICDGTQLKSILSKNGVISQVWIKITEFYNLHKTEQVWDFISKGLGNDDSHLREYLLWKDIDKLSSLLNSAFNDDRGVIDFIWELGGKHMNDQEKREWLFDSFECGVLMDYGNDCLGWSFHKFIERQLSSGFLSGEETIRLLRAKDKRGNLYILQGYPYGLFTHILPIDHKINDRHVAEIMRDEGLCFHRIDCWYNSSLPLNEDLKDEVDKLFEEVTSRDRYGLVEQLEVDDRGFLVCPYLLPKETHPDRFKFCIVAFYKQVQFIIEHFNKDGLINCSVSKVEFCSGRRSILDKIYLRPSLHLGYVFSTLIESLSRGHFLSLLLHRDERGNSVLEEYEDQGNAMELTTKIFGGNSVSVINSISQDVIYCVNDFYLKHLVVLGIITFHQVTCRVQDEKRLDMMRFLCQEKVIFDDDWEEEPMATLIRRVWIDTVGKYGIALNKRVMGIISGCFRDNLSQFKKYLLQKDLTTINALSHAAYNEDPEVIQFIWELAGECMNDQEKREWLFDSFVGQGLLDTNAMYLGWSFHKFIEKQLKSGFLSGEEIICLLKSKDKRGNYYILRGYPYGLFNHILPLDHKINIGPLVEIMGNEGFYIYFLHLLCNNVFLPLNEDLKDDVDRVFEEVRSRDRYGLVEPPDVDEDGFLVGKYVLGMTKIHQDKFKFFVAALFQQIQLCRDHLKTDVLFKGLKRPEGLRYCPPNAIHLSYDWVSLLGYVSSILIEYLSRDDFLTLLFEPDRHGCTAYGCTAYGFTAFHRYALEGGTKVAPSWNKLNDVTEILLGKDSGSANQNESFTRHDLPDSKEALEEILDEWKRIWTLQKQEEGSEMTLRQLTGAEEMDVDREDGENGENQGEEK